MKLTLLLLFAHSLVVGQVLKSNQHGLGLIYGNASKEDIINNIVLSDGNDLTLPVLRFDHVGYGTGLFIPMIISEKEPFRTDSLGLIPIFLSSEMVTKIIHEVEELNTKNLTKPFNNYGVFRITFRYNKTVFQYFTLDTSQSAELFKKIEQCFVKYGNNEMLSRYHTYLHLVGLLDNSTGSPRWNY